MVFSKKRLSLYGSILLLFLVGVYAVFAADGFSDFYITGNATADYSSGSITLNWREANITNSVHLNATYPTHANITYFIYGSQANASGSHNAFVLLGTRANASAVNVSGSGTTLTILTFANVTGVTGNYTFRINATLYNATGPASGPVPIMSNLSSNRSMQTDAEDPTASLSSPSNTVIDVSNQIKYTCTCSDSISGLSTCVTTLTKPGSTTVTKSGSGTEHTFTGTDTNRAGEYTVSCAATDIAGRGGSASSKTFSALYPSSPSGGGSSSGGSSTSGSTEETAVEVQQGVTSSLGTLSTTDTFATVPASGGLSFTVNNEAHTAKVLTVTSTSATIEFASTPSQVTLNIGETKEVDLNDNGKMDLSVTLTSVTNGKADLVFKAIQEVVDAPPAPVTPPTEETKNMTWLWILIGLVVIGLIWYFVRKK